VVDVIKPGGLGPDSRAEARREPADGVKLSVRGVGSPEKSMQPTCHTPLRQPLSPPEP
jgi:hypothetical protein